MTGRRDNEKIEFDILGKQKWCKEETKTQISRSVSSDYRSSLLDLHISFMINLSAHVLFIWIILFNLASDYNLHKSSIARKKAL